MNNLLEELNDAQRQAVTHQARALKVVAGAGTGKTRVITRRIAYLIHEKEVDPENILAITFTNKAAAEMKERINVLTNTDAMPTVSTFHSLGAQILRRYAPSIGLENNFIIRDQGQTKRILKDLLNEAGYDTTQWKPKSLQRAISNKKSEGLSAKDFRPANPGHGMKAVMSDIWPRYEARLRNENALDFDDLILRPYQLLRDKPEIRARLQKQWSHIHVDEYQDTSRLQYRLIKLLVGNGEIFVVGDGDQTIYTWRGATLDNILSFEEDFSDSYTVTLSQNYRSTKRILEAANDIISHNQKREDKKLTTAGKAGEKLRLVPAQNEKAEAQEIADAILKHERSGGAFSDWAVLYRTNFQSRVIEEALTKAGISYQIAGTGFFQRAEVRDVLAYVTLALNQDSVTDLKRIINTPRRGIGKKTLERILDGREEELSSRRQKKVREFFALIEEIRADIKANPPSKALEMVLDKSGLKKNLQKKPEDQDRLENVFELVSVAAEYDDEFARDESAMLAFLENAQLASDQDEISEDGVQLMTVHAAKGLEFPHVWVAGMEDELFPRNKEGDRDRAEEERRLFYVALTRAQEHVTLSYAQSRRLFGNREWKLASPFLSDINTELIEVNESQESFSDEDVVFFD